MSRASKAEKASLKSAYLNQKYGTPISVSHYTAGSFRKHFHDFLEIVIINDDSGYHRINGRKYVFYKGAVYFLSHFHRHEIVQEKSSAHCDYYNITFQPEVLSDPGISMLQQKGMHILKPFYNPNVTPALRLSETEYNKVVQLCKIMLAEIEEDSTYVVPLVINILNTILNLLAKSSPFELSTKKELIILKVMEMVNNHFQEDVTTCGLAAELGLSASRLSQLFRELTGKTIKELLVHRRMLEAKKLLSTTQMAIQDAMYYAGFKDPSYFNRTFRKHTGKSPGDYRNELNPVQSE